MSATLTEPVTMSDKKRDDETVKISRQLVAKARVVVEARKLAGEPTSLGQYLSDLLSKPVERDFAAAVKQMGQLKPE